MLWQPSACCKYYAVLQPFGDSRATVCKVAAMSEVVVGLLGPCHVQAALNGVGLQVLVVAFYSLMWLLKLGGLHSGPQ